LLLLLAVGMFSSLLLRPAAWLHTRGCGLSSRLQKCEGRPQGLPLLQAGK
jgi:hypothetical protein